MASQAQIDVDISTMPIIQCGAFAVINKPANVVLQIIQMETPQLHETPDEAFHKTTALLTREPAPFDCSLRSKATRRDQLLWVRKTVLDPLTQPTLDLWQYVPRYRIEEKLVARHDTADRAANRYGLLLEFEVPRITAACNDGLLVRVEHTVTPLADGTSRYERLNTVLVLRAGAASNVALMDTMLRIGREEVRQQVMWFKEVLEKGKVRAPYIPSGSLVL